MMDILMQFAEPLLGLLGIVVAFIGVYFAGNKSGKSKVLVEMEKENVKSATVAKENLEHITNADERAYLKQLRDGEG